MSESTAAGGAVGTAAANDPVLQAMHGAEAAYRAENTAWHQREAELDGELAAERAAADRQRRRAECLDRALREIHGAASVEASGEGRPQGGGLLVDLLEHVVLKHAELDSPGVPVHLEALSLNRLAVHSEDPY